MAKKKELKAEIERLNGMLNTKADELDRLRDKIEQADGRLQAIGAAIRYGATLPGHGAPPEGSLYWSAYLDDVKNLLERLRDAEERNALTPSHLVDMLKAHRDTAYGRSPTMEIGQVWLTPWNARVRVVSSEKVDFGREEEVTFEYVDSHHDLGRVRFRQSWNTFLLRNGGHRPGWRYLGDGSQVKVDDSITIARPYRRSGPGHTSCDGSTRGSRCYLIAHFDSSVDPPVLDRFGLYSESAETLTADHVRGVPFNVMWVEAADYGEAEAEMTAFLQSAPYFTDRSSFNKYIARMLEERKARDTDSVETQLTSTDGAEES